MAVGTLEGDAVFLVRADHAVFDLAVVEFEDDRSLGAAQVHPSARQRVAHRALELHPHVVAVLEDRHLIVHEVLVRGEGRGQRVRVAPLGEGVVPVLFVEKLVFGREEVPAAETRHPRCLGVAEPVDEVEVVAAFFQDVRTRYGGVAAPVRHDVAAVVRGYVLLGADREQFAELARVEHLLHPLIDRGVAQHEARCEEPAAGFVRLVDLHAVVDGGADGLFGENVLARLERGKDLVVVEGVGRKDHHPRHAGEVDRLLNARAGGGVGGLPHLLGVFDLGGIGIVQRGDLDLPRGVVEQIAHHLAGAPSARQHRYSNLFHSFRSSWKVMIRIFDHLPSCFHTGSRSTTLPVRAA